MTASAKVQNIDEKKVTSRDDNWSKFLVSIAENRDESAFSAIYEHFAPLLKGFYLSNMPTMSVDQSEELVQEVMCKVWLKSASFDPEKSAASTWIYTIARNTRIDYLRKNANKDANTVELEADDIWDEQSENQPFVYLNQHRAKEEVGSLLKDLPIEQKQCLVKMYMESKSHAQLAEELDLPLGTVKSRIRLGLKRLQTWVPKQRGI